MDLTCTTAQAAPLILHCTNSDHATWLAQPVATVVTGILAICAAFVALHGARHQAGATINAQQIAADAAIARENAAADRINRARRQQYRALCHAAATDIGYVIETKLNATPSADIVEYLTKSTSELITKLRSVRAAEALDDEALTAVYHALPVLEAGLKSMEFTWTHLPENYDNLPPQQQAPTIFSIREDAYDSAVVLSTIAAALGQSETVEMIAMMLAENTDVSRQERVANRPKAGEAND